MSTIIGRTAANILALLDGKLDKSGGTLTGGLTIQNASLTAGSTTDTFSAALNVMRNGNIVGRIDNDGSGVRVYSFGGPLQLTATNGEGVVIDDQGVADFTNMPTVAGAGFPSGARPGSIDRTHMPAGNWVRPERMYKDGAISSGSMVDNIWLVPFFGSMDPNEVQSVDRVRCHFETAGSGDSQIRIGIYDSDPTTWKPTGNPVRQTTVASNAAGQVEVIFTAWQRPTTRPIYVAFLATGTTPATPTKNVLDHGASGWYGSDGNAAGEPSYTNNSVIPLGWRVAGKFALNDLTANTFLTTSNLPTCALRYV